MPTKESVLYFECVRNFLMVYLPNQKSVSVETIRSYHAALRCFIDYTCKKLSVKLSEFGFDHCSRVMLESFLDHLENEQGCTVSTRNQRLSAVRRFFKYAAERDISIMACYQEMMLIPIKKTAQHDIDFFSESALSTILAEVNTQSPKGIRDLTFMILLYDTGARLQEILDLRPVNLHISNGEKYVVIAGKGNKTRIVPLMDKTIDHLKRYISIYHRNNDDTYLFYTVRHQEKQQMSQDNVSKFIKKYGKAARSKCVEVPEHLYAHMFRHSRATHLYRNGMALPLISEWLGHEQVETTIKYYANADLSMKEDAIAKATSKLNPLTSQSMDFEYKDDDETIKRLYGLA